MRPPEPAGTAPWRRWLAGVVRPLLAALPLLVGSAASAEALQLRWAHAYEPGEVYHQQAERAARAIEDETQGRVRIAIIASGKAGKEPDYPGLLSQGAIDLCYCGMAMLAAQYPPLALSHYPFAFQDIEHARKYLNSTLLAELMDGYHQATGHTMLAGVYYGARHVTANKALTEPEHFKGQRFRVAGATPYRLFAEAMGATPAMLPLGEVYGALQERRIDMQENPLPTIRNRRFYEQQRFVMLTAHIYDITSVVVGRSAWDKLTPEDRRIVARNVKKAALWVGIGVISQELVDEESLRAQGMAVVRVNRAPFRERMRQFAPPEVLGVRPGDYARLQAIAGRAASVAR